MKICSYPVKKEKKSQTLGIIQSGFFSGSIQIPIIGNKGDQYLIFGS